MNKRQFVVLTALVLGSAAVALGQSAPMNDDFANRTFLAGASLTFGGTLAGATMEPEETNSSVQGISLGGSVWWSWTAPQSTTVVIELLRDYTSVSSSNTEFAIYSGTNLSALTRIDGNSFDGPPGRYAIFAAASGASYQFRVAGRWGQAFSLRLTATNPPVFVRQPRDCVVSPYGTAFFSAIAGGLPSGNSFRPSTSYQWKFGGVAIAGETAPCLLVRTATTNQIGSYSVIASNSGGLTESATATLTLAETNPVPRLAALMPGNPSVMSFALTGEGGRWYKIESSLNLTNWVSPGWIQNTNETALLSIPRLGPSHFVRASLNVPSDICVGQLKQLLWAQYIVAIERRVSSTAPIGLSDLGPYIRTGPLGSLQPCPEYGNYTAPYTISGWPTCYFHNRGHVLTDAP